MASDFEIQLTPQQRLYLTDGSGFNNLVTQNYKCALRFPAAAAQGTQLELEIEDTGCRIACSKVALRSPTRLALFQRTAEPSPDLPTEDQWVTTGPAQCRDPEVQSGRKPRFFSSTPGSRNRSMLT